MATDNARSRPVERANGAGQPHFAKGPLRYTDEQIYRSDRSFLLTFAGAGALAITLLLIASGALADWVAVALITASGAIATIRLEQRRARARKRSDRPLVRDDERSQPPQVGLNTQSGRLRQRDPTLVDLQGEHFLAQRIGVRVDFREAPSPPAAASACIDAARPTPPASQCGQ